MENQDRCFGEFVYWTPGFSTQGKGCRCCGTGYDKYPDGGDGGSIYEVIKTSDGPIEDPTVKAQINSCHQVCEADPQCAAFEFDFNDPTAKDNCKIWTVNGQTQAGGDDSENAYCFLKTNVAEATASDEGPADTTEDDKPFLRVNSSGATQISGCEWGCSECEENGKYCAKCQDGFFRTIGVCIQTNE